MNNMVFHTILFFHICLLCLQMLSYVPAGVPLYTEFYQISLVSGPGPRDLISKPLEMKSNQEVTGSTCTLCRRMIR